MGHEIFLGAKDHLVLNMLYVYISVILLEKLNIANKIRILLQVLAGHEGPVVSVQFSSQPGSTMMVSTGWDGTVKVWDAISNTTARESIALSSDGKEYLLLMYAMLSLICLYFTMRGQSALKIHLSAAVD